MTEILQLNDFAVTRLLIDWHQPSRDAAGNPHFSGGMAFDYNVLRRKDAPHSFALQFKFTLVPEEVKEGYEIEAAITGLFDFPPSMEESKMQSLIRINGCTILYGILRGEIATFTGSFPGGKFLLPTVFMQEVVQDIEKRKQLLEKKKTTSRKTSAKPKKAKLY